MISLLLAHQKLLEKLSMGLVTSLLLPSDPCCYIPHSIQGKKSKSPRFQQSPKGRSMHCLKTSAISDTVLV